MLIKTIKEISSHSLIYSLATIASSAASIILLPIYTRYLSRTDYGILEILEYTNVFITIIVAAGFNSALPRFVNEAETSKEKSLVISTAIIFSVIAGVVACLVFFYFNDNLSLLILGAVEHKKLINLNIIVFYLQLIVYISNAGFIATKKSKIYLGYMFIKLVLTISFNIYFIVILQFGVLGMLYGNIIGSGLTAIILITHTLLKNGNGFSYIHLRNILFFGLPLVPATVLATLMHNADKYLIRYFCTLSDVGIYALGYKFSFMLNVLIMQSFNYIWTGSAIYEIQNKPDSAKLYGRIGTYAITVNVFAQLALSVFSVPIIRILADPKFYASHEVIPFVSLGLSFHAFYFFFSIGAFTQKKTWLLNIAYLPATALSIIANIYLLPKLGYMAAAFLCVATYLSFISILYLTCRGLIKIEYDFKRILQVFGLVAVIYAISSLHIFENTIYEIIKGGLLLVTFPLMLFVGKWFKEDEKEVLRGKKEELKKLWEKRHRVLLARGSKKCGE